MNNESQEVFCDTKENEEYIQLSPRMALQLAAPHTWPAAILPVLFAVALAVHDMQVLSLGLTFALLLICILMQAAVNTMNDYYDFIKGADSKENQHDPTDAVLVYNKVNPRSALFLALGFLLVGLVLGVCVIFYAGWVPLVIGLLGAAIIVFYSAGKSPLSYLPLGEMVSGVTMGALIPLACYYVLTGSLSLRVLLLSVPLVLGIGLIMFTNNTCDIEKDIEAKRKTLAVILGREKARRLYRVLLVLWITVMIMLTSLFFTPGLVIMVFMLLIAYPALQRLWVNPLVLTTRVQAMAACLDINIICGISYAAAILFGSSVVLVF